MSNKFLSGVITALLTPWNINNQIDILSFDKILRIQMDNNINSVLVAGSTGENTSLSVSEYKFLIQHTVSFFNTNQTYVISGCNGLNLESTIDMCQISENLGVKAILCCIPPYVRTTQYGILEYFKCILDNISIPIILYSVPSRTSVDFSDDTIITLSNIDNVIGIKDSSTDFERILRIRKKVKPGFVFLCGNDMSMVGYNANGGSGIVSVISNILPSLIKKIQNCCSNNDYINALDLHSQIIPLCESLFRIPNPIGIKYAAYVMNLCDNKLRLPLMNIDPELGNSIREEISKIVSFIYE